jgi:GTP-binding protein EngB required for normal cell division
MESPILEAPFKTVIPPVPTDLHANQDSSASLAEAALRESIGIEDHWRFIERLLNEHKAEPTVRLMVKRVRDRIDDPRLYLAIVGEFNAGKSTFINALLREDLLRTDVIQGTTAAATLLGYGPKLKVDVAFEGGEILSSDAAWARMLARVGSGAKKALGWLLGKPKEPVVPHLDQLATDRETLRKFLHRVSADEEVSKDIRQVTIEYPSHVLQGGLMIVDTPGGNVDNRRHADVTATVLRDIADVAAVVIPAPIPVPESLVAFLETHLKDSLRRCVFLATQLDKIRPRERERQIQFIRQRLVEKLGKLGLTDPVVIGVAPQVVVDDLNNECELSDEQRIEFIRQFDSAQEDLLRRMSSGRVAIQVERTARLLNQVLGHIDGTLAQRAEEYRTRHYALQQNQIPNLAKFITEQKAEHLKALKEATSHLGAALSQDVNRIRRETVESVEAAINGATSKGELKKVIEEGIPHIMREATPKLESVVGAVIRAAGQATREVQRRFLKKFQEIYRRLATLGGRLPLAENEFGTRDAKTAGVQLHSQTSDLTSLVSSAILTEGFGRAGGATGGAVLGTLILPGIGTAIGAAVGWAFGGIFGTSLDVLKADCRSKIVDNVNTCFGRFDEAAPKTVVSFVETACDALIDEIDRYFRSYERKVQQMIERDRAEALELAELDRKTQVARREIALRREQLTAALRRLQSM